MKKIILMNLFCLFLAFYPSVMILSQTINISEAAVIASNWIQINIDENGAWGLYESANIERIQELNREGRKLGYFSLVKPSGFIVISVRKELAPVKAYSYSGSIDFGINEGMPGLIKDCLERVIQTIEKKIGPIESVKKEALKKILEIDYSQVWQQVYDYQTGSYQKKTRETTGQGDYQEGNILLTSQWDQGPPYNNQCPWMDCNNSNGRAVVGCVATAGAQIMKYWSWPPYGAEPPYNDPYDWVNMRDAVTTSSPPVQQDAVAELCNEIGVAVDMEYGCDESGAHTSHMEGVYEDHYFYDPLCDKWNRSDYSAIEWFDLIKIQLNENRPIHYEIPGHNVVVDGWREPGDPIIREYHVNYGWGGTNTAWFLLDGIPGGEPGEELFLGDIFPVTGLGYFLSGTYGADLNSPPRYFDRAASGSDATFSGGQHLQTLPGIMITGIGNSNGVRFEGSDQYSTYLYTNGDAARGIRIGTGGVNLKNNGSIRIYKIPWQ